MQAEDKILLFTVHVCSGDFMRVFLETPFVMFVFTILLMRAALFVPGQVCKHIRTSAREGARHRTMDG